MPDFVGQEAIRGTGRRPGYTVRDELGQRVFLRGTVGIALDWADTGGSQFFLRTTAAAPRREYRHRPRHQRHGHRRQSQQNDVIRRIRVWMER